MSLSQHTIAGLGCCLGLALWSMTVVAGCSGNAPAAPVAAAAPAAAVALPVEEETEVPIPSDASLPVDPNLPPPPPPRAAEDVEDQAPVIQVAQNAPAGINPFPKRLKIPEFPKDMEWINSAPLAKKDLKGKFVLLDFWTYCCINCIHILPELKKLEKQYPNELVVIGVHSAKFETEKDKENILSAVLRYEIQHPVINDNQHQVWNNYGVSSWPTAILIDPEGMAIWGRSGEFKAGDVAEVLSVAIPYYRQAKLLDEKPMKFDLAAAKELKTALRFPGKVLADEKSNRLFISDSNHNRIVVTTLDGQLLHVIGSGAIGRNDGDYASASFDHPQGCALAGEMLYVADTENHMLRKIDLRAKTVTTIAGTGEQARHPWPGLDESGQGGFPARFVGPPSSTGLNSPWALWVHDKDLYIAMAGPHQIWKMPLSESEIGPYAGNGREDIVDGPLLPRQPYAPKFSSFAQPSGLTSDGTWLYVADSEGSSIRAVPFDSKKYVRTVVGSDHLSSGRLFAFGDNDGPRRQAKLQHALGVTYVDGKIYTADTYNNKIKVVDAKSGEVKTIAGTSQPGSDDAAGTFDEPAGISHAKGILYIADTNNHLIRTLDISTGKVGTLPILGLASPVLVRQQPSFTGAAQEKVGATPVKLADGAVELQVSLKLPVGWKINPLAPMSYYLAASQPSGIVDRASLVRNKLAAPTADFKVRLPVSGPGEDEITLSLNYYYCQEANEGLCKVGSVVFTVPLKVAADAQASSIALQHVIAE